MSENSSFGTSTTRIFLGVASLGAGSYHGFCDAQGIPLPRESLESALTWGPALIQGGIGGIIGLFSGAAVGGRDDGGCAGMLGGAALGTVVVGGLGAVAGAVETLVGYGIGYAAGYLAK